MYKYFLIEFSNFLPAIALDALHCEMMVKLRDNARTTHIFLQEGWVGPKY